MHYKELQMTGLEVFYNFTLPLCIYVPELIR